MPGVDYITAAVDHLGQIQIIVTDVKTTTTGGSPPKPKTPMPREWSDEVRDAVLRLKPDDLDLEAKIRAAYYQGRVRLRQFRVNYAPDLAQGIGRITGW